MQPLSYQILPCSCWVTSMLNGLLMLHGDKNRMSGLVYRFLHTVLTDEGVYTQGRSKTDLAAVFQAIEVRAGIRVSFYFGADVECAVRKLNFIKQVAVCDIDSGEHAILLTGRFKGWIEAFDPDWHNVKHRREHPQSYIVQPDSHKSCRDGQTNLLINENYLVSLRRGHKGEFRMGAVKSRTLTVMEKYSLMK